MNKKKVITLSIAAVILVLILMGVILLINHKTDTEAENPVTPVISDVDVSDVDVSPIEIVPEEDFSDEFNFAMVKEKTGLIILNYTKLVINRVRGSSFEITITIDKKDVPQLLDQISGDQWRKRSDFSGIPIWEKYNIPEGSGLYEKSTPSTIHKGTNVTSVVIVPNKDLEKCDVHIRYKGE